MVLTDYFRSNHDITWDFARQLGVTEGTVRLPEDPEFDPACREHWLSVHKRFTDFGIRPLLIEPLPNCLHDHIKNGDRMRDECIEKVIRMFPIMDELDIRCICFNFMAHIGWQRTSNEIMERGGARVTGFRMEDFHPPEEVSISREELWNNYDYFIRTVIPEAEKYGIKLALHPDDPPLERCGNIERIMTSADNIEHAVRNIYPSDNLGITFCQATYYLMGENLEEIIPRLADKIMFIHFRNATGRKTDFHETFHDNGDLNMPNLMQIYHDCGLNVPVRVDHVPTMAGETIQNAGYDVLGRLYAIGYLKGILETIENR